MIDKGRISSINNGMAVVIPSWTDEAVTCPLTIPPRLRGVLSVDTNVVYTMFDDVSGEIIEVIDDYEDTQLRALDAHINDKSNPHLVSKTDVGLGNVDNTSDVDKPVSTDQQAALNGKSDTNHTHRKIDNDLEIIGEITVNNVCLNDPELEKLWSEILGGGGAKT
ncbi:hypothetical protein OBO34_07110 [Clostridiales Family XIII bacterium ASD5510]|uniref:Uncharacterized protein n=1 Tax=Hominibacterium faecale TaxID=2839743 RepID=A0A9J6QLS8_9FIRM|nr:hypothetical protein [Hominibacterium faecale]MCU7378121.1 hypothetical protein [Hominibacterium faecale]